MLWKPITIPGKPKLAVIDGSSNAEGWEAEFSDRIFANFQRRGMLLKETILPRVNQPTELERHLTPQDSFNCILLFTHAHTQTGGSSTGLEGYWDWLSKHPWASQKLLAICTWEQPDPSITNAVLKSDGNFAPLALIPQSPMSPREAGLYYMKFFAELDLHTSDSLTGKMVWFSASKAKELLRRRNLTGSVGVNC